MLSHVSIADSSLWLNSVPLYGGTQPIFCVCSPVSGRWGRFQYLAVTSRAVNEHPRTNICTDICFHFPWVDSLGVNWLNRNSRTTLNVFGAVGSSGRTILRFYRQRVRALVPLQIRQYFRGRSFPSEPF